MTFFDGSKFWSLDDLSENDVHLRYLLEAHAPDPNASKTFCPICCTRAPCDIVSLAATGLARAERLAAADALNARLVAALQGIESAVGHLYSEKSDAGLSMLPGALVPYAGPISIIDRTVRLALATVPSEQGHAATEGETVCTRCGDPITDGSMIGDGDGSGRRFAHPECYRQFPGAYKLRDALDAAWLDQMLIDAGREPGSMTLSEFKERMAAL